MVHRGQRQTYAGSLPTLLRISRSTTARRLLGCRTLPALHPVDPEIGEATPDLDWSVCPFDLLDSPFHRAVLRLDRLAAVSPLDGWPTRYATWAVFGLLTLRATRGET